MIYWLTGQPGHGKTVIGKQLYDELHKNSDAIHIDGDEVRDIFKNFDYSEDNRKKNMDLIHDFIYFMDKKGFNVVVSMVSPYREQREVFKSRIGSNMVEVYVHTSETRGRENLHVKNYEPPIENFCDIDTTNRDPQECATKILEYGKQKMIYGR